MKSFPFASARIFGTPLLVHPGKARVIAGAFLRRTGAGVLAMEDEDTFFSGGAAPEGGYDVVDRVAVIPIEGTLVHKSSSLRPFSGVLGYNAIRTNLAAALQDRDVEAIVLLCNSPGGEVSGCFDLAEDIYQARGSKPITAICDDMAYSACYALASAADSIVVPASGGVGSVGVITMHADYSKALEGAGVHISILQHGERKAAGNQFNPLSKMDTEEIQADIDSLGGMFTELTARNRGLAVSAVRDLQARTFLGAAGVDAGLADAMMSPADAFSVILSEMRRTKK